MLTDLMIRNLAVVEQLHVSFAGGFSVLTGETGAGKSIIIDAVGLLLGQRMRTDLVRSGEQQATVEAVFDLSRQPQVRHWLAENDFAPDGDSEGDSLMIKRVLSAQGKSRVYLNGSLATLGQLQQVTAFLLTIYGQHDQQQLQRVERHLELLDGFDGGEGGLAAYQQYYRCWQQLVARQAALRQTVLEKQQRQDLLAFQRDELQLAALRVGECDELTQERLRLQYAERLCSSCGQGEELLYAGEGAVCEQLGALARQLDGLLKVEPRLQEPLQAVNESLYALEDVAAQLRGLAQEAVFDEQRQQEVEERLAQLQALQRKYGQDEAGLLRLLESLEQELDELQHSDETLSRLDGEVADAYQLVQQAGAALSQRRRETAEHLVRAVEQELAALAMPNARFAVEFSVLSQPGASGFEKAEFYFSANPGQELRPLAATASGGELSRVMLALRKSAPLADRLATLIFDEVDAGIGGIAATAVGESLRAVAHARVAQGGGERQVLCVTHLPQVAACADIQYRIEKQVSGGQTRTRLIELDPTQRIEELARMLGGARMDQHSLDHARSLLLQSQGER
ncbi:MAG: DNA repair protein RecN [Desulfuromonadaceae bacterium]|nr:DNA repair protein RecN [Desulfuromonadaceae bacterium]